jgi:hypothetical protein
VLADIDNSYVSDDITLNDVQNNDTTSNAVATLVQSLSLSDFRRQLIVHFDIAYRRREIKWPTVPKKFNDVRSETTTAAALDHE